MRRILSDETLDILFRNASSPPAWLDRPVGDTLLRAVWELVKLCPASDHNPPIRILFVRSEEAKARLLPALAPDARALVRSAPVIALLADGRARPEGLDRADAPPRALAMREGALCGAFLILGARALGLDCRPIWDFDPLAIENALFPEGAALASFLCAVGYGDEAQPETNRPQPGCDAACLIL
jgi:3-hydroxypropanoate dehydrogenase